MNLPDAALYDAITTSVVGGATHCAVKCSRCGKNFPAARGDIANYFRSGWPICCGETAMFSLKKDRKP